MDVIWLIKMASSGNLFCATLLFLTDIALAANIEWTFGLISNISSLKPSKASTYLYENYRNQSQDCFVVCTTMVEECQTVTLTKDRCYCSTELTPYQSEMNNGSLVYFKRPVKLCTKPGYIYYNNTCFKRSSTEVTWQEAKLDCEATGGNMIVLDSLSKHRSFVNILKTYYPTPTETILRYFVGASDINQEGNWTWIGQDASNFIDLVPNETRMKAPKLDCAALGMHREKIAVVNCLDKLLYVCEES